MKGGAAAACLLAMLLGAGCNPGGTNGEAANNVTEAPAEPVLNLTNAIPLPKPGLDREALLLAAIRAASAHAAGRDDREAQASLAGRQFSFRIRFGCHGPASEEESEGEARPLSWSYDPETERLSLRAIPDLDGGQPQVRSIAGEGFKAVQGFWIHQPWLLDNACPAHAVEPDPTAPTLGIAQFFTESNARPRSRSAYESVQRLAPDTLPGAAGFDLILEGRLTALPGGRVIRCATTEASARPVCLISAEPSRISIENGATGVKLAEWGRG